MLGHGSRLKSWQFLLLECSLDCGDGLDLGMAGQQQFRPFISKRQHGARGRWIEAIRGSNFRAPEFGPIEASPPSTSLHAHPAILAFHRGFVATPAKDEN